MNEDILEQNTSGFYKRDGDELLFAPNAVYAPEFTLLREEKDQYQYPINGWIWAENSEEAIQSLLV